MCKPAIRLRPVEHRKNPPFFRKQLKAAAHHSHAQYYTVFEQNSLLLPSVSGALPENRPGIYRGHYRRTIPPVVTMYEIYCL